MTTVNVEYEIEVAVSDDDPAPTAEELEQAIAEACKWVLRVSVVRL